MLIWSGSKSGAGSRLPMRRSTQLSQITRLGLIIFVGVLLSLNAHASWSIRSLCTSFLESFSLRSRQNPHLPWDKLRTRRAKVLWEKISKRYGTLVNLALRQNVVESLPEGIPDDLVPAFQALNQIMLDNGRFIRWLISLEEQAEDALNRQNGETAELPLKERQFLAGRMVIELRARAAGWPEPIFVLPNGVDKFGKQTWPENAWRTMLREGHLFVETSDSNHPKVYHLKQLLYASEIFNAAPGIARRIRVLMQFMGDGYQVAGENFDTNHRLIWSEKNNHWAFRGELSLWQTFFDASFGNNINRPEKFWSIAEDLPILNALERWGAETSNYHFPL